MVFGIINSLAKTGANIARGYSFDQQSTRRIGRNLRASETYLFRPFYQSKKQYLTNQGSLSVLPPSPHGIPAKSGSGLGAAECDIMFINDLDGSYDEVKTGEKTIVFNNSESVITSDKSVIAVRNREGKFIAEPAKTHEKTGLIRVSFNEDFSKNTETIKCRIVKSEFEDFQDGNTVDVSNSIGLESDAQKRGFVYVYGDGTLELVNAECPDE